MSGVPIQVVPTVNDMLADLGIMPQAFLAELLGLEQGGKWFSASSPLVCGRPRYKVIAWLEGESVVADVTLASGTTLRAREPRTLLRLPMALPDTIDMGAPGHRVGQLVGHPLLERGSYVIDEMQVPGHKQTRLVWFNTALENLGTKPSKA